ncbi:trehalose-phosphatase [Sphingomonas jatrophae]|uniref:Trehalose 6-phosphate phosphatase n=1 Tax=Sphingomonas jatrophae TaxID=1166337 RepID=A0A1I6JT96_9SPHN|nr:trehalose-phosphatase [Sphingomonas jatrophae]SFR82214.1 trehalose 6-phosphate phosphatase [Sphingomonas jatrophae]
MGTLTEPTCAPLVAPPATLLRGASLFLDFDGTLAEIAPRPDAVAPDPKLQQLLPRLAEALNGRLALVSGRAVGELADFFSGLDLTIGGSHGAELRWAGDAAAPSASPGWVGEVLDAAERFGRDHPGVLVERKPFGIGLHYREAPDHARAVRAFAETLLGPGRTLQPGKMVIELRADDADKGSAIRAFLADPRMAGTRPIFIGDDVTDEDGFRAAAELGGAGVLVGAERETAATFRLADVAAVLDWLGLAAEEAGA